MPDRPLSSALYRNDGDGSFTDVTDLAGVGNADGYGMGLAVADYDNDGDDDLFVTNYGANVLYRNEGDGTFRDVTGQVNLMVPKTPTFSTSAAFLDYDRDGHLDLYVCAYVEFDFETNRRCTRDGIQSYCGPDIYEGAADLLYRNNGDGTFTDVSAEAGISNPDGKGLGVVGGDYDGDGWTDIFVANDLTPTSCTGTTATARLPTWPCWRAWPMAKTVLPGRAWGWISETTTGTGRRTST